MDLRTRYTALVTLITQYVKFASETLKRTEDEEVANPFKIYQHCPSFKYIQKEGMCQIVCHDLKKLFSATSSIHLIFIPNATVSNFRDL